MDIKGILTTSTSIILLVHAVFTDAQTVKSSRYSPDLFVPDFPFNTTLNYKKVWCEKQAAVLNSSVPLGLALAGETLSIAVPRISEFVNFLPDGKTVDEDEPGLIFEFLDEIARRGQFNWQFGFHTKTFDLEDYTMTDLLVWLSQNFDVAANWWTEIPARVEQSITFPKGWYDASIIIIGRKKDESKFLIFSWADPFTHDVWIMLFVTLLITGLIYFVLEQGDKIWEKIRNMHVTHINSDISQYIYKSFVCFSGHMDLKAKTKPGQLISFSLSFFAMLMLSAYTANLASFLVSKNSAHVEINTVGDIVARGLSMCSLNAAKKEAILSQYPQAIFVDKPTEAEAYKGLINRECDYAVSGVSAWAEFQNNQVTNKDCSLDRVGRVFKSNQAGFAMRSDSGVYCTSLLREVFHHHMLDMYDDEFVSRSWKNHVERTQSLTCSESLLEESMITLTLTNLGGIFLCHLALVVIAITSSLIGKYYNKNHRDRLENSTPVKSMRNLVLKMNSKDDITRSARSSNNQSGTTDFTTLKLHAMQLLTKIKEMEDQNSTIQANNCESK